MCAYSGEYEAAFAVNGISDFTCDQTYRVDQTFGSSSADRTF